MLPADDIIINCLLGGTVGSIYIEWGDEMNIPGAEYHLTPFED